MIQEFKGYRGQVVSVAFSPDGKSILTGSWDNTARLWSLKGITLQAFIGHKNHVSSVAFSPDRKTILTGSEDHTALLWKIAMPLNAFLKLDNFQQLSTGQKNEYNIE